MSKRSNMNNVSQNTVRGQTKGEMDKKSPQKEAQIESYGDMYLN